MSQLQSMIVLFQPASNIHPYSTRALKYSSCLSTCIWLRQSTLYNNIVLTQSMSPNWYRLCDTEEQPAKTRERESVVINTDYPVAISLSFQYTLHSPIYTPPPRPPTLAIEFCLLSFGPSSNKVACRRLYTSNIDDVIISFQHRDRDRQRIYSV